MTLWTISNIFVDLKMIFCFINIVFFTLVLNFINDHLLSQKYRLAVPLAHIDWKGILCLMVGFQLEIFHIDSCCRGRIGSISSLKWSFKGCNLIKWL